MKSRPKIVVPEKAAKTFISCNFLQSCNTSAYPEWGTKITRFKLIRRRERSKD